MKKLKRKDRIINALIISFVIGVGFVVWFLPPAIAYWRSSEVYKRYSKVEGVRATYIKDFRVNDTVTVGVTLLEATTDSGWAVLQEDFEVPAVPEGYEKYYYDSNRVSTKMYPKSVPLYIDGDTLMNDLIAISRYKHCICHFVITSKEKKNLIMHKHYKDNINHDIKTNYNEQEN